MKLDIDELSSLKVKDLQRELKKRGLDTGGLKAALVERLKEHLQQDEAAPAETPDADQEEDVKEKEKKEEEKNTTEKQQEEESQQGGPQEEKGVKSERGQEKKDQHEEPQVDIPEKNNLKEGEAEKAEKPAEANGAENGEKTASTSGLKRGADAVERDDEDAPQAKKAKASEDKEGGSPQPEEDDSAKPASSADPDADDAMNGEKTADEATEATSEEEQRVTLRIDNFVRPFTLNAVKALVQELGDFVADGFWMDAIKTHCYVTYPSSDIAEKTKAALNGKAWPPENGRSLKVEFVDYTAMEVSKFGEANLPSRPKSKGDASTQPAQRQKVTIDEFFQKTETKPVLYYLPLTDEQVKERKERQSQQPEGPPRKRRHRGGRKRNRRGRFQRR